MAAISKNVEPKVDSADSPAAVEAALESGAVPVAVAVALDSAEGPPANSVAAVEAEAGGSTPPANSVAAAEAEAGGSSQETELSAPPQAEAEGHGSEEEAASFASRLELLERQKATIVAEMSALVRCAASEQGFVLGLAYALSPEPLTSCPQPEPALEPRPAASTWHLADSDGYQGVASRNARLAPDCAFLRAYILVRDAGCGHRAAGSCNGGGGCCFRVAPRAAGAPESDHLERDGRAGALRCMWPEIRVGGGL